MKMKLQFLSNNIDEMVDLFGSVETIESIFNIKYPWLNGSFDEYGDNPEHKGEIEPDTFMFNNVICRYKGLLTITFNDEHRLPKSEVFTNPIVKPFKNNKQILRYCY